MALNKNHNWLSTDGAKKALDNKIMLFKKNVSPIVNNIYDKRSFCRGFARDMVVIESENNIFAISDENEYYIYIEERWEKLTDENFDKQKA